jgi:hypothetical protein
MQELGVGATGRSRAAQCRNVPTTMTDACTSPVSLRPIVMLLVAQSVDAQRRERERNPLVFRRYVEALLCSLNTHTRN